MSERQREGERQKERQRQTETDREKEREKEQKSIYKLTGGQEENYQPVVDISLQSGSSVVSTGVLYVPDSTSDTCVRVRPAK